MANQPGDAPEGGACWDETVRQISEIGGPPGKRGRFGRLRRNAAVAAEASAVTVLCRQLIAGVLVSDLLIDQLRALTGQTRWRVAVCWRLAVCWRVALG